MSQRSQYDTTHIMTHKIHQSLSGRQTFACNFEIPTQKHKNKCFGARLYSAGTQHRNLRHLFVTLSRVTYFILRACTGTGVSHSQHRKNSGEALEKCK